MPLIVRLALVFAGGAIAGNYLAHYTVEVVISAVATLPLLILAQRRELLSLIAIAAAGVFLHI